MVDSAKVALAQIEFQEVVPAAAIMVEEEETGLVMNQLVIKLLQGVVHHISIRITLTLHIW